jgi:acyl-CoA synthetase (AMP-forming)/AMP-acid ligase II
MLYSDTLEWMARHRPDDVAWRFEGRQRSWAEADARANRVANALRAAGHEPGQRIGILGTNSDQLAEFYFALSKAGLVAVPLNIRSAPAEIRFIVEEAEVSGFAVSDALIEGYRAAEIAEDGFVSLIGLGTGHGLAADYEDLVAAGAPDRPPVRVAPDALRIVKFTSGTTGTPKGCMGTHRECLSNVMAYLIAEPFQADDVCGLIVSLGSGLASYLLTAHVYAGCPTVILHTTRPGEILDAIEANGITRLTAVPAVIASLVAEQAARPRDLASLRLIGYTGAPATVDLIRRGHEVLGCGFYQSYGATESGGRTAGSSRKMLAVPMPGAVR